MFLNEARLSLRFEHPHIVRTYELGTDAATGQPFMVMEHLDGPDLRTLLRTVQERGHRLSAGVAAQLMLQTLDALGYAHALADADGTPLAVVHRDVSLANVVVTTAGVAKRRRHASNARHRGERRIGRGHAGPDTAAARPHRHHRADTAARAARAPRTLDADARACAPLATTHRAVRAADRAAGDVARGGVDGEARRPGAVVLARALTGSGAPRVIPWSAKVAAVRGTPRSPAASAPTPAGCPATGAAPGTPGGRRTRPARARWPAARA